jgi:hypothetical protein
MNIQEYLETCRELSQLTTQNGWIDNETLKINILSQEKNATLVDVRFEEIVMEDAGCFAARVECYGQVRLQLDENGQVMKMEIL